MRINKITIKGFRNLKNSELVIEKGNNTLVFIGKNGQGKTNLLEAIYICALSKSFRSRINSDLVNFTEDFCSIKIQAEINEEEKEIEVITIKEPPQKALKINEVKKKASDFIGVFKAVFFSPDDLSMMSFAPRLRRRYLDILLSQLNHDYLKELLEYQEVIRQRNALLKKIRDNQAKADELDFWDEKTANLGLSLIEKRTNLILALEKDVKERYKTISLTKDELKILYKSDSGYVQNAEELLERITESRERDIASGSTRIGPHHDDIQFLINNRDMIYFASRGEWRSLILTLKFAEIELIRKKTGESPVLLLDDVFSELDETRQKYLFEAIKNTQTFITTTHKEFLDGLDVQKVIYEMKEGGVELINN